MGDLVAPTVSRTTGGKKCACGRGARRILLDFRLRRRTAEWDTVRCPTGSGQRTSPPIERGYFYVGGKYVGEPGKEIMQGQIYVEVLAPKDVRRPYPLVLIHGAAQTATNWMGTPDGRKGWAEYFVEQGYVVYMIDQPMRGRSAEHPSDGPTRMFTVANEEWQFTASESSEGTWPQAKKHTQWPGEGPNKGKKGDPIFDAFYATQVETVISNEETQSRNRDAGAALLDKIGPAIVLTHSQSGSFGWLIADARPRLVKAIVAIEPAGPPFENTIKRHRQGTRLGTDRHRDHL
jgi:pimeloyl-ACP methyl ester carboxylesterase